MAKTKEEQKAYLREYYQANKEKAAEVGRARYLANKDIIDARNREYALNNKEKVRKHKSKWKANNKGLVNASTAKRRAAKLNATPPWLTEFDFQYMKSIYNQGNFLDMHVDHIVPLQGKNVSGLHVPWNLQLLEPEENLRKSNKF